jgi:peptidoglycan pentaglycine glycine transferase (the first glycine)
LRSLTTSRHGMTEPPTADDRRWDAFVAAAPNGEHVQTSMWARVKAADGWYAQRVVAEQDGEIVGGFQMIGRRIPAVGGIAYIPKGPLFADRAVAETLVETIDRIPKSSRIRHLTVQPAVGGEMVEELLESRRFERSQVVVAPNATLILDLTKSDDELLAEMNARTRYNIKLGYRRGLTFRAGSRPDIADYHDMLLATSRRQAFQPHSLSHLHAMWDVLSPEGLIELFLVEREGEAVAGMLAIGFSGTFINKLSVWSGEHGSDRPNETLQWGAIQWAKQHGFLRYDFEGIEAVAAEALAAGGTVPEESRNSVTSFKVGFGGTAVKTPDPWYRVDNPIVGWAYRRYAADGSGARLAKRMSDRLRTGR